MPTSYVVASITLDELAVELLPAHVVIAIDEVDIEYLLWERRHAMKADPQHAALPAISSASERTLPVVVFGDFVNYSPTFTFADKIACLSILDPLERLRLAQRLLVTSTSWID